METAKGHLDQDTKKLRSTSSHRDVNEDEDIAPKQEDDSIYTHDIMCTVIDSKVLNSKIYLDQTGRFPVRFSSSKRYSC